MDTYWFLCFIPLMLLFCTLGRNGSELRLQRIEKKLDALLNHLGIVMNPGIDPKILELVRAGEKIQAIKLYRESSGVGLKEAKDFIESL